jgi:Zn finger protein HypA/HybF involved in hydrogenase expression
LILYCGECHVNMCEVKRGRVMLVVLFLILYCGECHVNMCEVKRGRVMLVPHTYLHDIHHNKESRTEPLTWLPLFTSHIFQ